MIRVNFCNITKWKAGRHKIVNVIVFHSSVFSNRQSMLVETRTAVVFNEAEINWQGTWGKLRVIDVFNGFRKGRGTREQIANICWIIEKAREFHKNIYFCFIDYAKAFDCVEHSKLENSSRDENTRPPDLPPEKYVCRSRSSS